MCARPHPDRRGAARAALHSWSLFFRSPYPDLLYTFFKLSYFRIFVFILLRDQKRKPRRKLPSSLRGCPRMSACPSMCRSLGGSRPLPARLPACPPPCHWRPLEIDAEEHYLCCVQSCCPTVLHGGGGGGGAGRDSRAAISLCTRSYL